MTIFALDTNIISYLLKQDQQVISKMKEVAKLNHDCVIPPVAFYEVKRGLLAVNSTKQLQLLEKMVDEFPVGEMSLAAWDEAAKLYAVHRQRGNVIEDADLFIAAFCLTGNHTLVTNNIKHFEMIEGLICTNWKQELETKDRISPDTRIVFPVKK